jgi:glycosyltransferase involved in cell wall biosynthesis
MEIMHAAAYPQSVVFRKLKRVLDPNCKLIVSIHGVPIDSPVAYYTGRVLCKDADVVTTTSKFCAMHVKKLYGVESTVIYNGVNTDFFKPSPKDNLRLRVLYVGRLIKLKRPEWVAKLAGLFPNCDFIIQGVGPMETELKRISKKLTNLKVNTSYLSHEKVRNLYARSDIFLFPTTEAFGLVILEAMACGLPVLLHSFGGQSELIQNGREGLLAHTFKEMAENLRYVVEDAEARLKMGRNAREHSLKFRWEKIAEQYHQLYHDLTR